MGMTMRSIVHMPRNGYIVETQSGAGGGRWELELEPVHLYSRSRNFYFEFKNWEAT